MPPKVRKIPMRQCMGCNEHKPKSELFRVVRSPEGEISLDVTGRKNGRDVKCLRKARKSRRIETNLECSIPEEVYDRMEQELESYADDQS